MTDHIDRIEDVRYELDKLADSTRDRCNGLDDRCNGLDDRITELEESLDLLLEGIRRL